MRLRIFLGHGPNVEWLRAELSRAVALDRARAHIAIAELERCLLLRRKGVLRTLFLPPAPMNARAVVAEFVGTALLLAAIVGSGIMAERLCGGNVGLALLANAIATGGALVALILAFGPISGAHFNPAVTLADAWHGGLARSAVVPYIAAQIAGALRGTALANGMFGLPLFFPSHHARTGSALLVSEFVATFGLLAVIWGCVRARTPATPYAVAAYIVGAYWFTPSTSFANPAVTIARSLTDTFAGIRPQDAPGFIVAQLFGAFAATALFAWLSPISKSAAEAVVVPAPGNRRMSEQKTVLFVCIHNSARSQMAEAFVNARHGEPAARLQRGLGGRHAESVRRRGDARARHRHQHATARSP